MRQGWDATGLIRPLWEKIDGGPEELARRAGISLNTLYAYNGGSKAARDAQREADRRRRRRQPVYDLGAPRPAHSDFAASLLGQAILEIRRNPPREPGLLEELADEMTALAQILREVATELAHGAPRAG